MSRSVQFRSLATAWGLVAALALLFTASAQAEAAETVTLEPVEGKVTTKCRGDDGFAELTATQEVDLGCLVDATEGTALLTSAAGGGETQTVKVWAGRFRIVQRAAQDGDGPVVTVLKLAGPLRSADESGSKRRKLWSEGSGSWESEGERGSASIRATKWLVEDLSNETTRVFVSKGEVRFRDFVTGTTVTVGAGESYTTGTSASGPATAAAPSSSVAGYSNADNVAGVGSQGAAADPGVSAGGGTLPFTGLHIGFLVAGGILLLAIGTAMARHVARDVG